MSHPTPSCILAAYATLLLGMLYDMNANAFGYCILVIFALIYEKIKYQYVYRILYAGVRETVSG